VLVHITSADEGVSEDPFDEHIIDKSTETPPSNRHVIGNVFGATIDERNIGDPKKHPEGLSIDAERDKEKIVDVKPLVYENIDIHL